MNWDMAGGNLMNGGSWKPSEGEMAYYKRCAHTIVAGRLADDIAKYGYGLAGVGISKDESEKILAWARGMAEAIVTTAELTWEKKE